MSTPTTTMTKEAHCTDNFQPDDDIIVEWPSEIMEDDIVSCSDYYYYYSKPYNYKPYGSPKNDDMIIGQNNDLLLPPLLPNRQQQQQQQQPSRSCAQLLDANRQIQLLEANLALHKRIIYMEKAMEKQSIQIQELQNQIVYLNDTVLKQQQQQQQQDDTNTTMNGQSTTMNAHSTTTTTTSTSVTWKIRNFENKLKSSTSSTNSKERQYFQSSIFHVGNTMLPFYITVCVLEVDDDNHCVSESVDRPIAIFIKSAINKGKNKKKKQQQRQRQYHKLYHDTRNGRKDHYEEEDDDEHQDHYDTLLESSIFPLQLDGSSITLVGSNNNNNNNNVIDNDKTIHVIGKTAIMDNPSQGKGLRQFTTLKEIRNQFIHHDDDGSSIIIKATIQIPQPLKCHYQLQTM